MLVAYIIIGLVVAVVVAVWLDATDNVQDDTFLCALIGIMAGLLWPITVTMSLYGWCINKAIMWWRTR